MSIEIWKDIPGYEGSYQISNKWGVKSLDRVILGKDWRNWFHHWRIIKTETNIDWYKVLCICKNGWWKKIRVHRIVYCTFNNISIDTDLLILHKDDIRDNNNLDNLFIGTNKENMEDMYRKWRKVTVYGEDQGSSKLTNKEVLEIRENKEKLKGYQLSDLYKISQGVISSIRSRRSWKHI